MQGWEGKEANNKGMHYYCGQLVVDAHGASEDDMRDTPLSQPEGKEVVLYLPTCHHLEMAEGCFRGIYTLGLL